MLSKNTIKHLKKLEKKKLRQESGTFKVEGEKTISEFLQSNFPIQTVYATKTFFDTYTSLYPNIHFELATLEELKKASFYETNTSMLAVAKISEKEYSNTANITVVLDDISDPGNLGTIIRICDWYGISQIVCSENTVDCYNPKVVASTKGSLARVSIVYTDLEEFFSQKNETEVYGAFLAGENLHSHVFPEKNIVLIIGNESHGISTKLEKYITKKITIPRFGNAESLNAGVATGIIIDRIIGK